MDSKYFKHKQFEGDFILLSVRWYLKYTLSSRDLKDIMLERGYKVCHSTIIRWVHEYSPLIAKKVKKHLKLTNDSWRVDETYIKVKGEWRYLYRAVDSTGETIDFLLTAKRDKKAAKRFFNKVLKSTASVIPRVITLDKSGANLSAIKEIKRENDIALKGVEIRQIKYLNNIVEQDHRFIKKKVKSTLGFKTFNSAKCIISGIETMNMLRKRQVDGLDRNALLECKFINGLFGINA